MLPDGWKEQKISELTSFLNSGISRPFFSEPNGIPALRSNNVSGGQVNDQSLKYWHSTDPRGANLEPVKPKKGDILVNFVNGSARELGKAGVYRGVPENCIASTNFFIVRFKQQQLLPDYANMLFQSSLYRKWLYKVVGFTGQGSFNKKEFSNLVFPVPPIQEQEEIIEIVRSWGNSCERLKKLIAEKQKQKKALMQRLLTGKHRFPEFEGQEWQEVRLGQLFKNRVQANRSDLPLLSIAREDGVIPREETGRKDTSNADKSKYLRICPGDIGYNTMRMWQGVSALSDLEGIVSPAYTILEPTDKVDALFATYLFKHGPVVHLFERHSQGLTSDTWNLKYSAFKKIKVTVPSVAEQKKIAAILKTADIEIDLLTQKLEAYQEQKKGLMQQLLTGKKRVKLLHKEAA